MASFAYTEFLSEVFLGHVDTDTVTWKLKLVDNTSTCDAEEDAANIAAFTTLGEADGANYAEKTLANVTVAKDTANNKITLDCDDVEWTNLGLNTNSEPNKAALVYVERGSDSVDLPAFYIDEGGFPHTPSGLNFSIEFPNKVMELKNSA